jgi:hypothetical protein
MSKLTYKLVDEIIVPQATPGLVAQKTLAAALKMRLTNLMSLTVEAAGMRLS